LSGTVYDGVDQVECDEATDQEGENAHLDCIPLHLFKMCLLKGEEPGIDTTLLVVSGYDSMVIVWDGLRQDSQGVEKCEQPCREYNECGDHSEVSQFFAVLSSSQINDASNAVTEEEYDS
jgi:hypothetical protein